MNFRAYSISCLLLLTYTFSGTFYLSGENERRSEDPQTQFLDKVSTLEFSLGNGVSTTFQAFADTCFSSATINQYHAISNHLIPRELRSVELLVAWLATPNKMDGARIYDIPENLDKWIPAANNFPGNRFLSMAEIRHIQPQISTIAATPPEWKTIDPKIIQSCRELLLQQERSQRMIATFELPGSQGSSLGSWLNWISSQKIRLEPFQNKLEGLETDDQEEAFRFEQAYKKVYAHICSQKPISVIALEAENSESITWISLQEYILLSLDKLLIAPEILDWLQMLDSIRQENWSAALVNLEAIQSNRVYSTTSPILNQTSTSASPKTNRWITVVFWVTLLFSASFTFIYTLGYTKVIKYTTTSLAFTLFTRFTAETLALSGHFEANGLHYFTGAYAIVLATHTAAFCFPEKRLRAGLLWTSVITTGLLGLYPTSLHQDTLNPLIPSLARQTAALLLWIQMAWIAFHTFRPNRSKQILRLIDRSSYPITWLVFLLLISSQLSVSLQPTSPVASSVPGAWAVVLNLLCLFQLSRHFTLRWMNEQKLARMLQILSAVTLWVTASILLDTPSTTLSILITMTAGGIALSSYITNLPGKAWRRIIFPAKKTASHAQTGK